MIALAELFVRLLRLAVTLFSAWRPFALDRVVGPEVTQAGMFEEVEHVAASVVDGFRCCVFAYGITGGGKTFTMQGPPSGTFTQSVQSSANPMSNSLWLPAHL